MVTVRDEMTLTRPPTQCERAIPDDGPVDSSVAARIAAFLDGHTDGEDLLHALYDYVLDEPVPENMRALLRKS
jgi:hypothetical protein